MTITLNISMKSEEHLLQRSAMPVESAAVLIAKLAIGTDGSRRLIEVELLDVDESAYIARDARGLGVSSDGYVHALKEARRTGSIALWIHTHPGEGSRVDFSNKDLAVNESLRGLFAERTESGIYGAMVFGQNAGQLTFTGVLEEVEAQRSDPIERIWVAGPRLKLLRSADSSLAPLSPIHDRHVRAFGEAIPAMMGDLEIAIVGAGGVGSAVAEQLVRLGVRKLKLIDHDDLSSSNVTRVYGSTPSDVSRPKVDILRQHLMTIAPDANVVAIEGSLNRLDVARELVGADLVFGCTDDNAGRSRLSRFAYMYRTPVIDSGVLIDSDGAGNVRGIFGRVTILHPGAACLVCRDRIDLELAKAEERAEGDQLELQKEGYAPALATKDPAVIAYTTLVAATAVGELLERLVGYGDGVPPSEILLRIHDRRISMNDLKPTRNHYCDGNSARARYGDTEPFLGLNWAS